MQTNTIKVDKKVPMPTNRRGPVSIYPWKDMSVGESFLAPETVTEKSFRAQAYTAGLHYSRKFSVHKTEDGLRCWRIK